MGRKNPKTQKINLPKNFHLMYSTDEFDRDAIVVRYMGEQDGDYLLCWNPEGFQFWAHISHVWTPKRRAA